VSEAIPPFAGSRGGREPDPSGNAALRHAIDTAVTLANGPAPFVIDPDVLEHANDPASSSLTPLRRTGSAPSRHPAAR